MTYECPYCKSSDTFSVQYIGSKLECPKCGRGFVFALSAHPTPRQLFLDIETTGFRPSTGRLTTVVWFGDGVWGYWVNNGMSVDPLLSAWNNSQELITYNGRSFDEPWLVETLNISPHKHHIDLREESTSRGLSGGLKLITQQLGISRPSELDNMEGKHATKLWSSACKGNKCSLCNLLYYNAWDVVLTYQLHCLFREIQPDPIQKSMPFTNNADALRPFIRARNSPPSKLQTADAKPLKELWRERSVTPLTLMTGASVCFTGELSRYEREEAEALVSYLGGTVAQSAVRRLDFLVVGDTGKFGKTSKISKFGFRTFLRLGR